MKRILLLFVPVLLLILAFRPDPAHIVKGKVSDDKGNLLAGAWVSVKGTSSGLSTDAAGEYSIAVAGDKSVLVFTMVGYNTVEVTVGERKKIDIVMSAQQVSMQEVVVTGLGQRKLKNVSYPMSTLQGKAAGISVTTGYHNDREPVYDNFNTEGYDHISENQFLKAGDNPLSTFSIDVDAASYSNVRRYLNQGSLPPAGAVRIEEMINYFSYDYPQPASGQPFSINTEITEAPWNKQHQLVLIGLQGKKIPTDDLPASNLVFLIDVSGSMQSELKLPLVKASMKMLVDQLREQDMVSIVVYAGAAGLVLEPTSGDEKTKIKEAIDKLEAGGSTAGGAGIKLAYKTARENFSKNGNNRVILCSDGDFNVGASSDDAMERLIESERKSGVFLTVLGYGMGNYKDNKMQKLADKGNGNHAYIDGMSEAKKVLVNEFGGTLFTIAKDVKLQIEFNPAKVQGYRLIGYENRMLAKEDFNNDKKDAGELGSGHTVTALYEIIPVGIKSEFLNKVDSLKYQANPEPLSRSSHTTEIMTVKFRYKAPDGDVSKLIEHPVNDTKVPLASVSGNFRFAAAVAEFGMLLRDSEFKGNASYKNVIATAKKSKGSDEQGYRSEFIRLVENAQALARNVKKNRSEELANANDD
jgi:Ca-activated chloride channel family protein